MITRHHHTSLFVTDLDRSIAFYCDALGFELPSGLIEPTIAPTALPFADVEPADKTVP